MFSSPGSSSRSNRRGSGYRSARSIHRQRDLVHASTAVQWSRTKLALVSIGALAMAMTTILPMMLLDQGPSGGSKGSHHSLHSVISYSNQIKEGLAQAAAVAKSGDKHSGNDDGKVKLEHDVINQSPPPNTPVVIPAGRLKKQRLARGVSGLPMSQTPALVGARPGHIKCDVDVDNMAYWNDPQGTRDQDFTSPFAADPIGEAHDQPSRMKRYLTFEPDPGGWNNIRMSMEIIFVIAATTGRTLVLPPKAPFYLLGTGEENARSFGSFYNLQHPAFQKEVEVITMSEFLEREATGLLQLGGQDEKLKQLKPVADICIYKKDSEIHCKHLFEHLRKVGYQPPLQAHKQCLIFDTQVFDGGSPTEEVAERVTRFCEERKPVYYSQWLHEPQLIHWDASGQNDKTNHRLLNHFYSFLMFTDQAVDNHYKRFVRDFLHYKDSLYCSAGKVVAALDEEGKDWSTLHVRRGDLQYQAVKISAEEWYENLKEIWNPGEVLYIATDERNKTFFDPIKEYHEVRFLDDYWDAARLGDLDPYFLGMIDTIIASHGRTFSGTWFSTFTGYINRMRGYLGYSMLNSWYGWPDRKEAVREYKYPTGNYGAREWPIGWIAIDGDTLIEHEGNLVNSEEGVYE